VASLVQNQVRRGLLGMQRIKGKDDPMQIAPAQQLLGHRNFVCFGTHHLLVQHRPTPMQDFTHHRHGVAVGACPTHRFAVQRPRLPRAVLRRRGLHERLQLPWLLGQGVCNIAISRGIRQPGAKPPGSELEPLPG
jgi:hypothetical protein